MTSDKINFRYDINALRAIAVLGVVFFHYNVPYFTGGFAGVDVFFVISGYLMTRIIIVGINKGSFSTKDFYGKRLKRIVPALLFMVLIITLFCFFTYFPREYQVNERNAASSLLFLSNLLYWTKSNYFDPATDTNLFLHTWSLSVEWQFYLLYPLILLGVRNGLKNASKFLVYFTAVTLVIFVASIKITDINSTASFYLLPTRSWEMLFGGLAFLTEAKVKVFKYRNLAAVIGYLSIFACFFFLKNGSDWPGLYTIIPVAGTFLVIVANNNNFVILKSSIVQFIGRISYSLYLWHWPIYVIALSFGIQTGLIVTFVMTALSFALSYVSYTYVEMYSFKNNKPILALAVSLLGVTMLCGFVNVNRMVFKKKALAIANFKAEHRVIEKGKIPGCFINSTLKFDKEACLTIEKGKRNILMVGDSHALHFVPSFLSLFSTMNIHLLQASASGCRPVISSTGQSTCTDLVDFVYHDFIVHHHNEIDGVIISADWVLAYNEGDVNILKDIKATIAYLQQYKLKVIIIGQNETYIIPYPTIAAKEYQYNIKVASQYLNKNTYRLNAVLKQGLQPYYVNIINGMTSAPPLGKNDVPYMNDENHFTRYGADLAMTKITADPLFKNFLK